MRVVTTHGPPEPNGCEACNGTGHTEPFGEWNEVQTCPECLGRPADAVVCANCAGTGLCGDDECELDPCTVCEELGWFHPLPAVRRLNAQVDYLLRLLNPEWFERQRAKADIHESS